MGTNSYIANASSIPDFCRVDVVEDPDVTGLGVILSFILSVIIAMSVVFFAFFRRSIQPEEYNAFDDMLLETWPFRLIARPLQSQQAKAIEKARITTLQKFILATSDQLLITGMSLLLVTIFIVSGLGGLNTQWSVFSYHTAVYLAYASWTVHLSTLVVLREHFRHHHYPQNVRIGGMIVTCMLLFTTRFIGASSSFNAEPSMSTSCGLADFNLFGGYIYDGSNHTLVFDILPILLGEISILISMGLLFFLRLVDLYSSAIPGIRSLPWEVSWPPALMRIVYFPTRCGNYQATLLHLYGRERYEKATRMLEGSISVIYIWDIIDEIDKSFVNDLVNFLTLLTYTSLKLLSTVLSSDAPMKVIMQPNFSQVMPLLLLLLPLLNILDVSSEINTIQNEHKNNSDSSKELDEAISISGGSESRETTSNNSLVLPSTTVPGINEDSTLIVSEYKPSGAISKALFNEDGVNPSLPKVYSFRHMGELGLKINLFKLALRHKNGGHIAMVYLIIKFMLFETVAIVSSGVIPATVVQGVLGDSAIKLPITNANLAFMYFIIGIGAPGLFIMKFLVPLVKSRRRLRREMKILGSE